MIDEKCIHPTFFVLIMYSDIRIFWLKNNTCAKWKVLKDSISYLDCKVLNLIFMEAKER